MLISESHNDNSLVLLLPWCHLYCLNCALNIASIFYQYLQSYGQIPLCLTCNCVYSQVSLLFPGILLIQRMTMVSQQMTLCLYCWKWHINTTSRSVGLTAVSFLMTTFLNSSKLYVLILCAVNFNVALLSVFTGSFSHRTIQRKR